MINMAKDILELILKPLWGWVLALVVSGAMFAYAIWVKVAWCATAGCTSPAVWWFHASEEAQAAWLQAVGSLLAIVVAVAFPIYASKRADLDRKNAHLAALHALATYARLLVDNLIEQTLDFEKQPMPPAAWDRTYSAMKRVPLVEVSGYKSVVAWQNIVSAFESARSLATTADRIFENNQLRAALNDSQTEILLGLTDLVTGVETSKGPVFRLRAGWYFVSERRARRRVIATGS